MNAEDLVITLKKNMAKLSKSERRRAIESVRDIIRAAMFDDAAGSGYEVERCPPLRLGRYRQEGQVQER